MNKYLPICVLLFICAFQLVFLSQKVDWQTKEKSLPENYTFPYEEIESEVLGTEENLNHTPEELENYTLNITGWIPDWDMKNSLESLASQYSIFSSISPVWFYVNDNGSLQTTRDTNYQELISFTSNNEIQLIPTISLFDPLTLSNALSSEESMNLHISEILYQVDSNEYDGIDIDYEAIYTKDSDNFFEFLERLSKELKNRGKIFSVTVLAKWGDNVEYRQLPETRAVQDYEKIGNLADQVRIMTYDYSSRDSLEIGPIQPIKWQEDVIKYAITKIDKSKIYLGVATYAYNHVSRNVMQNLEYQNIYAPLTSKEFSSALAHFPSDIIEIKAVNLVDSKFNQEWGEEISTYYSKNLATNRIIVSQTQESIELRKALAAKYGIAGVAYWRVGSEGNLYY